MSNFSLFRAGFFFLTLVQIVFSLGDHRYEACKPRSCGNNLTNLISYPFWIHDDYCGYPEFKVTCKQGEPIINALGVDYIIKDINYTEQSFRVQNSVVLEKKSCPIPLKNYTFDKSSPFQFGPNVYNLSFFYNCTQQFGLENLSWYSVDCNKSSNLSSLALFNVVPGNPTIIQKVVKLCKSWVLAPAEVYKGSLNTSGIRNYTSFMEEGFMLKYSVKKRCTECKASKGFCGFENGDLKCFCVDQSYNKTCNDTKSITAINEQKQNRICTPLECGTLGKVFFPYSNITHPECGLYVMDCTRKTPIIDLKEGRLYDVKNIFYNETILIHDQILQHQLDSRNCNFIDNFKIPISPLITFRLTTPNLTLFKCNKLDPYTISLLPLFFGGFNGRFEGCNNEYVIYYSYPEKPNKVSLPAILVPRCSVIQLPLVMPPPPPDDFQNDLFHLLSAEFSLGWDVLDDCFGCYTNGGQCLTDSSNNQFQCSKPGNGAEMNINVPPPPKRNIERKVKIGIGAGIGGCVLTGLVVLLIVYCRRRRKRYLDKSSGLISSRNVSPDFSMMPDQEKGFLAPIFSYKELVEATNNFDDDKELGDGGFGTVYHGELKDGRVVAVKRLYENNGKRVEQFMNEVQILSRLRHKNLVILYGCTSRHSRELLLVYEFVPNGTVADHLHGERAGSGLVPWSVRMNIAIETADALKYLHVSEIIHRDVKTNNILLDENFHVKVADFGLSRLFPTDVTHVSTAPQGTPGYVDPEYYQCYQLTSKSDVYSFGVVLVELISSKPAVDISRHRHEINLSNLAINKIHNHALHELIDPSLGFETDSSVKKMITLVAELAFRCLQQDSDMRPSMTEVLEVLKEIENEGSKKAKGVEIDIAADDIGLLKNNISPFSPDSVTQRWDSDITPNTSS